MRTFKDCFRGLAGVLKPLRWRVLVSALLGLLQVALSLGFVWYSKRVVDLATGEADGSLVQGVTIFAAILLLQIAARTASRWWEGYIVVEAQNANRARVFSRVMRSIWQGRDRFHSADTINRLEEDIRVVVDFVCTSLPGIVVTACQFVAACIFLFTLSPQLGWILVFIMPVAVVGSRLFFRKMRSLTNDIRRGDSMVQAHMQENIQHRMVIRTMGSTEDTLDALDELQDDVRANTLKRLGYSAFSRTFMQLGFMLGYAAAFIWSVYGLSKGTVTYGLMTAFLQLVGQVQRPVAELASQVPAFIKALASEDRLLDLSEQTQEPDGPEIRLEGAPGVRVEGLSFKYPEAAAPVFEGLSFDFRPGTMTAILGPTGSGKSTLVKVIMNLLSPSSGSVTLYDPPTPSGAGTLCNFMYVPQGNSLMSGSIRQNLRLAAPQATDDQLWEALETASAGFVRDLPEGLDTVCAEVGQGLSEGQAQRIAIARALLRPGGILVLDEATSALDADTEQALLENIARKYRGSKTILCITHRPAATDYADQTLKLA